MAASAAPGSPAARLQLVQLGDLLLEQDQQGARVVNGQGQATRDGLLIARRSGLHQYLDAQFDQAVVVPGRFQALNFDVVSFHVRFAASSARPDCPAIGGGLIRALVMVRRAVY